MPTIDVAITGYGSIGRQIAILLDERKPYYQQKFDVDVRLVGVCGSRTGRIDQHGLSLTQLQDRAAYTPGLTGPSFMSEVTADVLIESGPTNIATGQPGLDYLRQAFRQKMNVICLSKGALVIGLAELKKAADAAQVQFRFSGATASALPTVDFLQDSLAGCKIDRMVAILTGTTNLILSEMMDTGCTYEEGLALAQRLGIAEPDPSADVDGWDTACKIVIIGNAVFDAGLSLSSLGRQGISQITPADCMVWKADGVVPKLLGTIERQGETYQARVGVSLLPEAHPLARIHGRMKGFLVETREMGEFVVMGGASDPKATAAAALKDLEHVLSAIQRRT